MSILERVQLLQKMVRDSGDYKTLADKIGVNYHWLQKFAGGHMPNPTLDNLVKVDRFFMTNQKDREIDSAA